MGIVHEIYIIDTYDIYKDLCIYVYVFLCIVLMQGQAAYINTYQIWIIYYRHKYTHRFYVFLFKSEKHIY